MSSMYSNTRILRNLIYAASMRKSPLRTYAVKLSFKVECFSRKRKILSSLLKIFELHNAVEEKKKQFNKNIIYQFAIIPTNYCILPT